jgi:O-succinylbenzoate synthase
LDFCNTVTMAQSIPSVTELINNSHVVSIPLRHEFRGLSHRETMIFEGENGPAEWAAFPEYDDQEAAWWLASALEQGFAADLPPIPGHITEVRINGIIPAVEVSEIPTLIKKFSGVTSIKLKVGQPGHTAIDDLGRISAIRQLVGPDVTIRLDANGAWEVAEAERNLFMFSAFGIDYVEQPVKTLADMAKLRKRLTGTGIRIAADESLRQGGDIHHIIDADAANLVILKVNPLGGIRKCLDIARQARYADIGVVVSSGLETSVGIAHAAHLQAVLAGTYGDSEDAGLGTLTLFQGDVVTQPLTHFDGAIALAPPVLDPRKLKKFRADEERTTWWRNRLHRVYGRLTSIN